MCDLENAVPFEELEKRRRKASRVRESIQAPAHQNEISESEAINTVREILNPSLKLPEKKGPYKIPDEVIADDIDALKELDVRKVAELREVFLLFDTDCDGLISKDDLRFTLIALGDDASEELLENMLNEAKDPLDVDAFVELMSFRTIELDPEDVLLEAWSKWDIYGTGKIEEKKMYEELINYGDKLTVAEANEALRHAPLAKPKCLEEPPMIDYPAFCRLLSGVRRRKSSTE